MNSKPKYTFQNRHSSKKNFYQKDNKMKICLKDSKKWKMKPKNVEQSEVYLESTSVLWRVNTYKLNKLLDCELERLKRKKNTAFITNFWCFHSREKYFGVN